MFMSNICIHLFASSVRWHFFIFRNSVETLCVSWALSLVECVAVWALKLPVVSAPLRSLHNRSPLDFLQHIPTYSKPTCHKAFLLNYGKQKKITHHMGKAGLEPINLRRIEGPSKLMQPKSLQKQKELHPF